MDYLSNLSEFIYDNISQSDVSLFELSKRIGVDDALIARWQKDKYMPSLSNLVKVADYFNVPIDYMLGISDSPALSRLNPTVTFVEQLTKLLQAKNISAYRLAQECGVGRAAVSKWLCGQSMPNFESIIKLSLFFGCSIDFLVGRGR